MPAIAQHYATITLDREDPIILPIKDGEVRMDEESIPYIGVRLTVPYAPELEELDPQAGDQWATVTLTRSTGRTDRISDLTRLWGPNPLSWITGTFSALTDITRSLYHDYVTPGAPRVDDVRTFRVMLREIVIDDGAAEATIQLASGEARLADWNHMAIGYRWPGADLVAKINNVLALAGFAEGLASYPASVPSDAEIGDEAVRSPGQSATDWLQQITRKWDLMCWCDEDGKWRLATNRDKPTTRTLTSLGDDRSIVNVRRTRSRDTGWVTAVMIRYQFNGTTNYDIASDWAPNPERARVIDRTGQYPGPGRAAAALAQLRKRGTAMVIDAVSDPRFTPGELVTVTTRTGTRTGRCSGVQWRLAADEMNLRLREVA